MLGLAAYGNPDVAYNEMAKMISFNDKTQNFMSHPENGLYLPLFENVKLKTFKKIFKKRYCCCCTKRLEDVVLEYILSIKKNNFTLALAGGIFSNVKLNQKYVN